MGEQVRRLLAASVTMRRVALASLVANVVIVVTGGAVRLTGSGLGCPTWPKCTEASYTPTTAMGYHGAVEFTNRTFAGVVGALAIACVLVALAQRDRGPLTTDPRVRWSVAVVAGIPAQAVLGGLTVLTHLNPWLVACHFLLSIGVIAAAYRLWSHARARGEAGPVHPAVRALVWVILAVTGAVLAAGTVVTGSGPHAGDVHARRTGLDPTTIAQLHTDLVMLLIGLSVAAWFALRATGALPAAVRAAGVLILVEASQAVIGFAQYFTHLPIVLVGLHMLGACLVWLAALQLHSSLSPVGLDPATTASPAPADPAVPADPVAGRTPTAART